MWNAMPYIWQLPQHLLGLLMIALLKAERKIYPYGKAVYTYSEGSAISGAALGKYILLPKGGVNFNNVMHEYGHSRQSLRWGPLYLLAVGLPSLCGNLWDRLFHKGWDWEKRHKWYYSRWPEKQADRLGGVEREREG